jgi:Fe-S cluster biosynthesis and repair protein YggX
MDIHSYKKTQDGTKLHPDDEALLDWTASMGDTAADELKIRQDRARAAARAALTGRAMPVKQTMNPTGAKAAAKGKKAFSRVLDESMQTWMKKTTYLSNDYSRKVHDFKSLAKTKQELAEELDQKRVEITKKRSAAAISQTFENIPIVHPSKKKLKPRKVYPLLPNVENWGKSHTHIIIDKAPTVPLTYTVQDLSKGLIANVEKPDVNPHMTCDVFVSAKDAEEEGKHRAVQSYDLDIIPLKDDQDPHVHFCFWINRESGNGTASYLPLPSRVQLSTGRPLRAMVYRRVERRALGPHEAKEEEERKADLEEESMVVDDENSLHG